MKDNVLISENGIEVYQSEIDILCDDYISSLPDPNMIYKSTVFSGMLNYIYKHKLKYVIELDKKNSGISEYNNHYDFLDSIFYGIYIDLCTKYNIVPSIIQFSVLCDIANDTLTEIKNGVYSRNGSKVNENSCRTVRKWFATCESMLLGRAANENGIGAIFALKANYGYRDNVLPENPQPITTTQATPEMIEQRRAARIPEKPELTEVSAND